MTQIAGGVVWNPKYGIVVVSQPNNTWSLPKGHVENGESLLDAAIREITEETGISKDKLTLIENLGSYDRPRTKLSPTDPDDWRTITMFLFSTEENRLSPIDPENPEARFIPIEEVAPLLTNPKDGDFFTSIQSRICSQ